MYVIIMMTWTCTLNVSRISIIIMIGTGINYVYFDHKNKKEEEEEKKGIRRETRTARRHIWLHHVSLYNEYNNIHIYICVVSHIIRAAAYPYVTPHISWIVEFPVRSRHVMPCHTSLNPVQVSCNFMSCQKVPAGVVTILHHTMGCGTPSWFCRSCWTYMIPIYSYIESLNIRATQTQTH